ncbi:MAG: hypothetical protein O9264_09135 [Leptospira sp.]|nr:hypothetical protein [Leptospira sp.]
MLPLPRFLSLELSWSHATVYVVNELSSQLSGSLPGLLQLPFFHLWECTFCVNDKLEKLSRFLKEGTHISVNHAEIPYLISELGFHFKYHFEMGFAGTK